MKMVIIMYNSKCRLTEARRKFIKLSVKWKTWLAGGKYITICFFCFYVNQANMITQYFLKLRVRREKMALGLKYLETLVRPWRQWCGNVKILFTVNGSNQVLSKNCAGSWQISGLAEAAPWRSGRSCRNWPTPSPRSRPPLTRGIHRFHRAHNIGTSWTSCERQVRGFGRGGGQLPIILVSTVSNSLIEQGGKSVWDEVKRKFVG